MVNSCAVKGCRSRGVSSTITYHRFPTVDPDLCRSWTTFCKIEGLTSATSRVCSLHFTNDDFYNNNNGRRLRSKVVPTIYTKPSQLSGTELKISKPFDFWSNFKISSNSKLFFSVLSGTPDTFTHEVSIDVSILPTELYVNIEGSYLKIWWANN